MRTATECPGSITNGRCSWCGGISGELFWRLAAEGAEIIPTDSRDKYYVRTDEGMLKFYTRHM